jgi:hypothetical protein
MNYATIAKKISQKYHQTPGLVGIIWIGSTVYGIKDEFADIDILLVVDIKKKGQKMDQFDYQGVKVEITTIDSTWLLTPTFLDDERTWIRQKSIILYDPKNILKNKFKSLNRIKKSDYQKTLFKFYKDIFISYDLKKSIARNQTITASLYILQFIENFSKFLFIYHHQPIPTFKWRWYFIKKEKLFDSKIIEKLIQINPSRLESNLNIIKDIEEKAQKLMLNRGFSQRKVLEPWLF